MIYGYIRVSTQTQVLENQKLAISTFCEANQIEIDKWVEEKISSRKPLNERKLGKLLKKLKKEDVLIASELSRLGRNLLEVMGILKECLERDCQIWTLKENYRLGSDIQSKVLAFAFSLAAEIERQLISERTKEALKRVKAEGKHLGRPFGRKSAFNDLKRNKDKILQLAEQNIPKTQIARMFKVDRSTIRRFINQYNKDDI